MKKIRVALMTHVIDNRQAKGSAITARRIVSRLLRDPELDITLVHYEKSDDPIYTGAKEIIIPYLKLPVGTRFFRTMLFFWKYRNDKFDIIHWFQARLYPFFWLAPARHIIATLHGAGDITAPGNFTIARRVFNFVLIHFGHKVSAMIGVSDFGRDEIIEYYKADPKRVVSMIYYNGGAEEYTQLEKHAARAHIEQAYQVSGPYILDVSRLQPHKNVDSLIRAYIEMRDRFPDRKEKLLIAGGPSFGHEQTYALARESRYATDIQFIKFVRTEDMNRLYSGAEVFVFPSLNEGFGMPLIESFASGTPVITSNVTALPEVAGGAAITVDPLNVGEIAEAMQTVLSDETKKAELIRLGLERAAVFTSDRGAHDVRDLYKKVVAGE